MTVLQKRKKVKWKTRREESEWASEWESDIDTASDRSEKVLKGREDR